MNARLKLDDGTTVIATPTRADGRVNGWLSATIYELSRPVMHQGKSASRVAVSYGLETILGDDNIAVFGLGKTDHYRDAFPIYCESDGPDWARQLIDVESWDDKSEYAELEDKR